MKKLLLLTAVASLATVSAWGQTKDTVIYNVYLSGTQENPAIDGYQTSGNATVEFTTQRDAQGDLTSAIVSFRVNWNADEDQTPTAMHIHRGITGNNGPVLINSGLMPGDLEAGNSGTIHRQVTITDPMTLAVVEEIMANPSNFYLNAHSTANPGGFLRGQLQQMVTGETVAMLRSQLDRIEGKVDMLNTFLHEMANSLGIYIPRP